MFETLFPFRGQRGQQTAIGILLGGGPFKRQLRQQGQAVFATVVTHSGVTIGIALGLVLGSVPIAFPGMPSEIKLGLAGGPLIAAILLSYYGPRFHLVTYTTISANLMLREWGLTFFLASTGLAAGDLFIDAFVSGIGWAYMGLGLVISFVPLAIMSVVARRFMKLNFHTIAGLLAGSTTSSSALSFVNSLSERGLAVLAYSTVYPLAMFLRIISGQIVLMLFFAAA